MNNIEELAKKYCEGSSFIDACVEKPAYIAGYRQAEKDLELSWEDIASINDVVTEMLRECGDNILYDTEEEFCREALKRFKDFKK